MYVNDKAAYLSHPIINNGTSFIHFADIASIEAQLQNVETVSIPEVIADNPQIHGFLHSATYGDNVAYLFGSLHAMRDNWTPLADIVEDAMRRSDVFAFEVYLEDLLNPELLEPILEQVMFLPDGLTLEKFLPADVYENFVYHLPSYGIEYEDVYNWNPVFLANLIEVELSSLLLEVDMDTSVDEYVWLFAGEQGLPRIGLETVVQQIEIVYLPPYEAMQEALADFISFEDLLYYMMEYAEHAGSSLDIADLYEANDKAGIIALFRELDELIHESAIVRHRVEMIMNYRSNYYARRIAGLLQETAESTTFFVTVGASHIIRTSNYQYNIINFLEEMGFNVEALF